VQNLNHVPKHAGLSIKLWLDLQPTSKVDGGSGGQLSLVCDPTIRQPGFDLPRQQWSLLNCFRMEEGHCGACRRKRRLTRHWSVSLRWDPDDVPHCRILSCDKAEWRLSHTTDDPSHCTV